MTADDVAMAMISYFAIQVEKNDGLTALLLRLIDVESPFTRPHVSV